MLFLITYLLSEDSCQKLMQIVEEISSQYNVSVRGIIIINYSSTYPESEDSDPFSTG